MILPDLNLLVYAYNSEALAHRPAKEWWESCLSSHRPVGLPWVVIVGYLRLMTSRHVCEDPCTAADALEHIRSWLERPNVEILNPGRRHLDLMEHLIRESQ